MYNVYTKKKRQRRLSINSLSIIYSYMDYKRLGRNSHFEREEMQGYSDAFIDLDKVPIVINGKKIISILRLIQFSLFFYAVTGYL